MVIWVCEASEVNNLTVLAVGPNHRDKDVTMEVIHRFYGGYTQDTPLQGRTLRRGPTKTGAQSGLPVQRKIQETTRNVTFLKKTYFWVVFGFFS